MAVVKQPNSFDYFDYKEYLKDYCEYRKSQDARFSHRMFLEEAGIPGTAYLRRVIRGERKLSQKNVPHFIKALGLNARKKQYFELMVSFGNEKSPEQKEQYLKDMLKIRYSFPVHRLEDKKLKFFQKWYYPVVREAATLVDFKENYNLLSRMIVPPITATQARNAVKYLLKNKYIRKNARGRYRLTERFFSSGSEVDSTILLQYHKKNLQINAEVMESMPRESRGVSSLTLKVSEKRYEEIRNKIKDFRQELLALTRKESDADMVCHVGFQLLPRVRNGKGKTDD
jgi:uncharacterized protein (TIGR02147 family)